MARVRVRHSLGWWWVCQITHQGAKFQTWNRSGGWGRRNIKFGPPAFLHLCGGSVSACVQVRVCFIPRGFSAGAWWTGADLWVMNRFQQAASSVLWRFLISFFYHTNLVL